MGYPSHHHSEASLREGCADEAGVRIFSLHGCKLIAPRLPQVPRHENLRTGNRCRSLSLPASRR
jgi:hypothetical protein